MKYKVLFIEDDIIDRMAIERFVKTSNFPFDYRLADSLKTAVEIINSEIIDAVIADYNLPDGTVDEIYDLLGDIPFIVVTAVGDQKTAVKALKSGAYDYIVKDPHGKHRDALTYTIQNAINHYQTKTELNNYRLNLEKLVRERTKELELQIDERIKAETELRKRNEEVEELNQELQFRNEQLETAKSKAVESDELKTAFLANISHEIRTPLAAILGFAELFVSDQLNRERQLEMVGLIKEGSDQLLNVISDIVDISQIDAGQIQHSPTEFNLELLLNELYEILNNEIKSKNKTKIRPLLKINLSYQQKYVLADKDKIKHILLKFVNNAVKFTSEGVIKISANVQNSMVLICVEDSGIGIKKENLGLIFHRFRQASNDFTRPYGGTGLGLTIAKGLSEIIGGKVHVDSTFETGSIFKLEFPFFETGKMQVGKLNPDVQKQKCILVVEDNATDFSYYAEALASTGAMLFQAENDIEAVTHFMQRSDIDLVLVNVDMTKNQGVEAVLEIKALNPDIPVLALTAELNYNRLSNEILANCTEILIHPVGRLLLIDKINKYTP